MIRIINNGVFFVKGKLVLESKGDGVFIDLNGHRLNTDELPVETSQLNPDSSQKNTIAYQILAKHNTSSDEKQLRVRFDALASHDITYVGIIQTARASGLQEFPMPYVLTNCHNSLCAVGGTINEDDHVFGLSAAQKYGGIYVPAHQAVIHQYMREMMTNCGNMILGSDSHTRYGALGTMGIGEGGPELVKQILNKTYDIDRPEVIAVYLEGNPRKGVGPQDVALAIIQAVFNNGFVKNKVMEFIGPGINELSVDFRNGIDVMTTETTCLSSIWMTDEKVEDYYKIHGRPEGYVKLQPGDVAYYDGMIKVDLNLIEPMIAMPFHPSNAFKIREVNENTSEIIKMVEDNVKKQLENPAIKYSLTNRIINGRLKVDQGIIAGCAGGSFENLLEAAAILENHSVGNDQLSLSAYPASQPIYLDLVKNGSVSKLMLAGIIMKTAFCGPCFGAGDVPANGQFSIRHSTRNFPNREGSKPGEGQISSVALMDARSIAATARNGGFLTPATEVDYEIPQVSYEFNQEIYEKRVYQGFSLPIKKQELTLGPNIADWPKMISLPENLLLKVASVIQDPVTTTDELIPSGETSSYRSNPIKLAEFTLSRKDSFYVKRAKEVQRLEEERRSFVEKDNQTASEITEDLKQIFEKAMQVVQPEFKSLTEMLANTGIGSTIYAIKPGDGSAREQAASSQKVLGGWANIASEYATKRYRSNLINWGMLPFTLDNHETLPFIVDDYLFIPKIREKIIRGEEQIEAQVISSGEIKTIKLRLRNLTKDERDIILSGCLINYYNAK